MSTTMGSVQNNTSLDIGFLINKMRVVIFNLVLQNVDRRQHRVFDAQRICTM